MRKTYCDHCGKTVNFEELSKYRYENDLEYEVVVDVSAARLNIGYGREHMDLCKDCQMAIDRLVTEYLSKPTENMV